MIVLSNLTEQTLQPGQALTFDDVKLKSGNCECFNSQLPTSVKLKACCAIYKLSFTGNVATDTAGNAVQLSMGIGTQPLVETRMDSAPAAANAFDNVHSSSLFRNSCGDANRISIINSGTNPVIVAPNSAFVVERRS